MLKSESTTDIQTKRIIWQTLYSFIIAILFYKNRLSLTEENKKQEPCRQHSTMSLIEISKPIPKNLDYSWRNQILPKKNDTQNSGNSQKMIPKNPGATQKKYPK